MRRHSHQQTSQKVRADGEAAEGGFPKRAGEEEDILSEVRAPEGGGPRLEQLAETVERDGVGAGDDEELRPARPAAELGHPVKCGEHEQAPAGGEQAEGRRPDAFDGGDKSEGVEAVASDEAGDPGEEEAAEFAGGLAGAAQPFTGHEAEDHGGEVGDEVERLVAADVKDEGRRAQEKVEEPDVEGVEDVGVFVPRGGGCASCWADHAAVTPAPGAVLPPWRTKASQVRPRAAAAARACTRYPRFQHRKRSG